MTFLTDLARKLKPYVLDWIDNVLTRGARDIGTASEPFDTIYADTVTATTVVGQLTGGEWEYSGDPVIDANVANSTSTVYVVNQATGGVADLDVENNIIVGGTVDGVDIASFKSAYDTHDHDSRYYTETEVDSWRTSHIADANAHHSQVHGLVSADHTVSGLSSGQVLRESSPTSFTFGFLSHSEVAGVTADQHHTAFVGIRAADGNVAVPDGNDRVDVYGDGTTINTAWGGGGAPNQITISLIQGGVDHGSIAGLADDDHAQYVHISTARTISAKHTFNPSVAGAPFALGANAIGQNVAGLDADSVDGYDHDQSLLTTASPTFADLTLTAPSAIYALNHDSFAGFVADEHVAHSGVTLTAGAGLTGGGTIAASRTFDVGAGAGITVNANDVALTTPGTLTVSSSNNAAGSHTHAITSTSNATSASILASDSSGQLQLVRAGIGAAPNASYSLYTGSDIYIGGTILDVQDVRLQRLAANQLGLGTGDEFRTSNYVSGVSGWQIQSDGTAEFANVYVRGELHAALFVKDLIEAHAGTMIISKSAGKLEADMTVPTTGTWSMTIKDPPGGGFLFDNSDICRFKSEYSGGIIDLWFTVSARVDNGDGTQSYTCTYQSGDRTVQRTYSAGAPVIDYGVSGQGVLVMTAELNNAPYYDVLTHSGSPWSSTTLKARMGNLAGVTDPNMSPTGYGFYSDNVYLTGDFVSGGGAVTIDTAGGISIDVGTNIYNKLTWLNGASTIQEFETTVAGNIIEHRQKTHQQTASTGYILHGSYGYDAAGKARTGVGGHYDDTGGVVSASVSMAYNNASEVTQARMLVGENSSNGVYAEVFASEVYMMGLAGSGSPSVGIGTTSPATKLHVTGGADASLTSHGYLVLGPTSGANMVLDDNEIMARNNGANANMYIQWEGGDTYFGGGAIRTNGRATIGSTSQSAGQLAVTSSIENSGGKGEYIDYRSTISTTGTYYPIALSIQSGVDLIVESGITNNGYQMGIDNGMLRRNAADAGTLNQLIGSRFQVGHYTGTATARTTNSVHGLLLEMYHGNGTIGNSHGIRIQENSTGATITGARYSLYSNSSNLMMYHAGPVLIGTSSTGAYQFDVNHDAGSNWLARFHTANTSTPYGVLIQPGTDAVNGYPVFAVLNNAGNETYFRVDSGTGNVGIYSVPDVSAKLKVGGDVAITASTGGNGNLILNSDSTNAFDLIFQRGGSGRWSIYRPTNADDLRFYSYSFGDVISLDYAGGDVEFHGYMGFDTSMPGAQISFGQVDNERKILLWDSTTTDDTGFGKYSAELRYFVGGGGNIHSFYHGGSAGTKKFEVGDTVSKFYNDLVATTVHAKTERSVLVSGSGTYHNTGYNAVIDGQYLVTVHASTATTTGILDQGVYSVVYKSSASNYVTALVTPSYFPLTLNAGEFRFQNNNASALYLTYSIIRTS